MIIVSFNLMPNRINVRLKIYFSIFKRDREVYILTVRVLYYLRKAIKFFFDNFCCHKTEQWNSKTLDNQYKL